MKAITLAIDCIQLHEITFFAYTNVECKRLVIAVLRSLIFLFFSFYLRFLVTHLWEICINLYVKIVSRWCSNIIFVFSSFLCCFLVAIIWHTIFFFQNESTTFSMHWKPQNYSLTFHAFAVTTHNLHFSLKELRFLVFVSYFFTMHTNWFSDLLKSVASLVAKSIISFSTLQVQVNCVNHFFCYFDSILTDCGRQQRAVKIIFINTHTHSQAPSVASGSCDFGLNSALLWLCAMFLCRVILMLFRHWFLSQLRKSWQKRW